MFYSTIVIATDRRVFSDLRHLSYARKDVGHQVTQRQRKHVMTAFGSVSACDRRVSMRSLCQSVFRLHCWSGLTASAYLSFSFLTGLLALFESGIEAVFSLRMRGSPAEAPASFGDVYDTATRVYSGGRPEILARPASPWLAAPAVLREGCQRYLVWTNPETATVQGLQKYPATQLRRMDLASRWIGPASSVEVVHD